MGGTEVGDGSGTLNSVLSGSPNRLRCLGFVHEVPDGTREVRPLSGKDS